MSVNNKRKLTKNELRRIELFHSNSEELLAQGYIQRDLTLDLVEANIKGTLYGIVLAVPFLVVYLLLLFFKGKSLFADGIGDASTFFRNYLIFFVILIMLIVVHELIHGITWGLFSKGKLKSVEFGIIWRTMNPYCTCKEPLTRNTYLLGGLMPCILLGIIPCIVAWFIQSGWILAMGLIMIISAGGDLLIAKLILDTPTSRNALYLDHPTTIGLVIFDREQQL